MTEIQVCTVIHRSSYCTLPEGHNGPHGISVGAGVVVAPWDGGGSTQEETELFCEYCGGKCLLTRQGKGGTFDCSQCEQFHNFSDRYGEGLYHTSGPACRLYPQKMDRQLEMEYVKWQRKGFLLNQDMYLLLREIDQSEHDERVAQCETDVNARLAKLAGSASTIQRIANWLKGGVTITMGARGYSPDGTGGEIAVYLNEHLLVLLKPSKFSYWLFNTWSHCKNRKWDKAK